MRILVTGATAGLGAHTATTLADLGHVPVCLGRDPVMVERTAAAAGGEPCVVDLADLGAVRAAARRLGPLDAVIANAAVQVVRGTTTSRDGIETTLAVNHLAHLALVDELLGSSTPPRRVVVISSDTHDAARRTGTPAPLEASIAELARPPAEGGRARELGMRRYVTSKQLLTAAALGLAHEHPHAHVTAYNPGVMPGTRLDRDHPGAARAAWAVTSRLMLAFPFASRPAASARSLARLVCDDPPPVPSGTYVDAGLRVRSASDVASDPQFQRRVLDDSRSLLASLL